MSIDRHLSPKHDPRVLEGTYMRKKNKVKGKIRRCGEPKSLFVDRESLETVILPQYCRHSSNCSVSDIVPPKKKKMTSLSVKRKRKETMKV